MGEGQEGLIETTAECLREADGEESWRPVGIYDGETPVGFAMYGYFPQDGRLWLDRLLIDARHQGRGYGKRALRLLIGRLFEEYDIDRITLSVYPQNTMAKALYERHGFRLTGALDKLGELIMELPRADWESGQLE